MPLLPSDLRSALEKAVIAARDVAEEAAHAALAALAVDRNEPFTFLDEQQRRLRNALRAKARQQGNGSVDAGLQGLIEEVAYEQWHRMLFARFLAENGLLMHPSGVPVTLEECAELAQEKGEADAWQLAARYASAMLPGIFRSDDPSVQVRFAPEGHHKLERILADLPSILFIADDALGWVYQFWQTKKKQEINASQRKIGGADIAPVTQLFTEDYMVRFLLENSLGAWWAARHPQSSLLKRYSYLRYCNDGTPTAGTFPGWSERAAEITVIDPCCGSGHFLVAAFEMLRYMRIEEEGLSAAEAADAVLRDNLFGLELDPRCTQIAAFALAFAAWKISGYRPLPIPNVACSGIPVVGQLEEWTKLAGRDVTLTWTLERLYNLFSNAPDFGSLINPSDVPLVDRMFAPDYAKVEPLLEEALAKEHTSDDPVTAVFGAAAEGVARAARLLAGNYTLVATNVPYLTRSKQGEILKKFCDKHHPDAKGDLATAFVERCQALVAPGGSYGVVTPQNWLFLGSYRQLREQLLKNNQWDIVIRLGPAAFQDMNWWAANTALLLITACPPLSDHSIFSLDVSAPRVPAEKDLLLRTLPIEKVNQAVQLSNPDARIILGESTSGVLLEKYAYGLQGIATADYPRFGRKFWELPLPYKGWEFQQSTVEEPIPYGGREHILFWQNGRGELAASLQARIQGLSALGKRGIAIGQMRHLPCTLYTGELFDNNTAVILPRNPAYLSAIWAFCSSPEFALAIRKIDQKVSVTNATLVKIPFDLEYWKKTAEASVQLPEPSSDDLTQWLFSGQPVGSSTPLQAAVARLLGYHWAQQQTDVLDEYAAKEGIICLPPVAGEQSAAERLRVLLATAYGAAWSHEEQERLLASVGFSGVGLDTWLRDGFFIQHCALFHNRPFIWHIWDGRKDGFSALVNYHKLDAAHLDILIYTYLGTWIATQRAERDAGVAGADGRLIAALELQKKLEAIREGEPDFDIYVRWKPLHLQPIGWNPDLNDGVRLNIRPFVTAGVLRNKFTINWNKDRGTDPDGGERINDRHHTRAEKWAAREAEEQEQ